MGEYQRKRAAKARADRQQIVGTLRSVISDLTIVAQREELSPGKGKFDGNCNRTACQEPIKGRNWFNTSTRAYYCRNCAHSINHWSLKDDDIRICVAVTTADDRPAFKMPERV